MESGTPPPPRRPSLTGRIVSAGARTSLRATQRVAESTGLDRELEDALERAMINILESDFTDRLFERMLDSDQTQKLIERIAEAPEVRRAIAAQGVGMLDDIRDQIARATEAIDARLERIARSIRRRPQRAEPSENAGLLSRAAALALDFGILNLAFLLVSAAIGYLISLISPGDESLSTPAIVLGGGAWATTIAAYCVFFWCVSGQTPGMRFLNLRVRSADGNRIGVRQALRRVVGTALSILPLGLGFLPVLFDERRRAWSDRMAQTEVSYTRGDPLIPILGRNRRERIA
jgi:uncharacterized RDD family membrane protein YckC